METAVYDSIARQYQESKELPFRQYVETYSLFTILGKIKDLTVLDLACGEGFYTRKLAQTSAKEVIGVDISLEMIQLALEQEQKKPLGCQYHVHDAATLPKLGNFDRVVAMYLLNYARSRSELQDFCRAAYRQLRPGGYFVGINDNPLNGYVWYESYRKYGFVKDSIPFRREGTAIKYTFYNSDGGQFQFNNYYFHPNTYEEAFAAAGFTNFQWRSVSLDPAQQGNRFWDHFLAHPPIIGFSAQKK
ncbi:MAG: class I SAM-dependent methyltransferase [Cyclobacteriaceae bacterium]